MEGVMIANGGVLSEFGAKPGSRGGSRIGRVTKLVKPFWPAQTGGVASEAQKEAVSESMSIKHSRYSERRIEKGMEAIIDNLMKEPEGTWVSRVTLKQRSRSSVGDTGLLNFSLRCVENRRVGDSMVVRRSIHPVSQVMAYRLERIDSNSQEHAPVFEERRVSEAKPQAPKNESGGEGRKEKGGKPKPVRRKKEAILTEEQNMSSEEREEAEFEEGLSTLFALGGQIRPLPAMVDGQPVNLMLLYQHVACNGGYEEVSKRREWNVVAAQMGFKLEAGPCLKLLHAKYLLHLELLLGDLAPPPEPKRATPSNPLRTRSSSTCTSESSEESEEFERTTLPSLQAVSEGSLGQQLRCTETEATSSACSLKVEEDVQAFKEERDAFSRGCEEKESKGLGGLRVEGASLDLGPETSVEGSLLTDALPSLQTVEEKRSLTDLEMLGGFAEPLPVRKSGVYGSGAVSDVSRSADVAASHKRAVSDVSGSADVAAPHKRAVSDVSGSGDVAAVQKRVRLDSCAEQPGTYHGAAVPTTREQDGGANLLEECAPLLLQSEDLLEGEKRMTGSVAFRNLQALTLSIQEPDSLGPQDANAIVSWEGFRQPEPVTVKPKTLSPQRLKLILNPSPRKLLSPRTVQPSPRNLTLSPTKWMQSLNGQKRKAGELRQTPEQRRSREFSTGHPLKRPRCYLPLITFAEPPSPHLTGILTAIQELLMRHRDSVAWQEGLGARFEFPGGRRTRKKQAEEESEYIQPRIGSRYQAQVPEWNPKAAPRGHDLSMTSELEWISRPVCVQSVEATSDPGPKRPTLKRLSSQPDARKHLVSEARNVLESAVGTAGDDLGLLEMGECVAKKWTRGQEQRFLLAAAAIPRGEAMGEEFYGEGYFRALCCTLPEKSLAELVSYYYNVYKVRCKRQDSGSRWAVEKKAPEGGAVAMFTAVEHTGVA